MDLATHHLSAKNNKHKGGNISNQTLHDKSRQAGTAQQH